MKWKIWNQGVDITPLLLRLECPERTPNLLCPVHLRVISTRKFNIDFIKHPKQ